MPEKPEILFPRRHSHVPVRRHVQGIAQYAVRRGLLVNPGVCELCGDVIFCVKHHPEYSKPLVVVWLCMSCHNKLHPSKGL